MNPSPATAQVVPKSLRILVGDDQLDVLEALRLLLKGAGYQTVMVDSPQALLRAAQTHDFDLILMDLNYARDTTSGQEGLDLLAGLQAQNNTAPIIVMTAWGSVDLAVEAMRRGACDFVQKPWDNARLLSTVRKQADEATEKLQQQRLAKSELEIAHNVQQKLFPQKTKRLKNIDYAGQCVAARQVSGDYYDFLDAGENYIGFVIADVSGKGIPAALLMANLQASFRSQTGNPLLRPAALLHSMNKQFYESTSPEHFATLFFGIYDDRTSALRYANCGHLAPILLRANGESERLSPTATVLGAFQNWSCSEAETAIHAGDTLLLFSDGITEAGIDSGDDFGEERLLSVIRSNQGQSIEALVETVIQAVSDFSDGAKDDDVTAVGIRGL